MHLSKRAAPGVAVLVVAAACALASTATAGVGNPGNQSYLSLPLSQYESVGVNVSNGNLLDTSADALSAAVTDDLSLTRFYNSQGSTANTSGLGPKWLLSAGPQAVFLSIAGSSVTATMPSGATAVFTKQADGSYTSSSTTATLAYLSSPPTYNGTAAPYKLVDPFGNTDYFSSSGSEVAIQPLNDSNTVIIQNQDTGFGVSELRELYDSGAPNSGVRLSYFATAPTGPYPAPQLQGAEVFTTFTDNYSTYASAGDSMPLQTFYQPSPGKAQPNGPAVRYGYNAAGLLSTVTEPDGTTASITYDNATPARVATLSVSGGPTYTTAETLSFSYPQSGQTTVTYQTGYAVNYSYDATGVVTSVTPVAQLGTSDSSAYDGLGNFDVTNTCAPGTWSATPTCSSGSASKSANGTATASSSAAPDAKTSLGPVEPGNKRYYGDIGCSASGYPSAQDGSEFQCLAVAQSKNGFNIPIRHGRYNFSTRSGYGWIKTLNLHNLRVQPMINTITYGTISGQPNDKGYEVYYFEGDPADPYVGLAITVVANTTDTDPNTGDKTPDKKPFGVVTGYCSGPLAGSRVNQASDCPEWVNERTTHPQP